MQVLRRRVIESRSESAEIALKCGDFAESERLYSHALQQAEICDGFYSPLAGSVLLGLHDLYEKQGREEEATRAWERIRLILLHGWGLLPLSMLKQCEKS